MIAGNALPLSSYQGVLIVVLALVGLNLVANLRMLDRIAPRGRGPSTAHSVSVLIPARNEAHNIGRCLSSLLAQNYPLSEVLVLDDGSTDATADIVSEIALKDPRLRLVRGQDLPQGWMGKNFACHQLAQLARGDWLLFADADTQPHPTALAWALEAAEQNQADLLSLIPRTVTHTPGEDLVLPIVPFGLLGCFPLALGRHLRMPVLAMAYGPFMLFRRDTYRRIGGHEVIQGEIAEDVALAQQVVRADGQALLLDGSEQLEVHSYRSFWESWHGLAKSVFAALGYRLLPTLMMMGFYGFLFLSPVAVVLEALLHGRTFDPALRLPLLIVFLNGALWYIVAVRFRLSRLVSLFYPLTILLVLLIMLDSIRQAAFAGIGWKERVYRVRDGALRH